MHSWFVKVAVVYFFFGVLVGMYMSINSDFTLTPFHAHVNLLGWVSMALYGIIYRIYPNAGNSKLAPWHFWIANLGFIVMMLALFNVLNGKEAWETVIAVGANGVVLGVLLFAINVLRNVSCKDEKENL